MSTRYRLLANVAVVMLAVGPVAAKDLVLTYENASSVVVSGSDVYPLDEDGEPIEDNYGGFHDDLPVGETLKVNLGETRCRPMLIRITLANGKELRINLDTCADTHVRIVD